MNKFLQKLAKLFLGISMAAGVGVAIGAGRKDASSVDAADATVTYTATSASAVSTSGTTVSGSSATLTSTGSWNSNGVQMTNGKNMTLTITGYDGYKISGLSVSMRSNSSKGTGSLTFKIGGTTKASIAESAFNSSNWYGSWSTSYVTITPTLTTTTVGTGQSMVLSIACKSGSSNYNSLYFKSLTLTYSLPATGITLNKSSTSISAGQSETLTATVTPNNATDKTVSWSISPSGQGVSVSSGTVSTTAAATPGEYTVTATANGGTNVKATCTVTVTSAHTHTWVAGTVHAPTCTEQGYTEYTCSGCSQTKNDDYVAALGHDYGEWIIDIAATCTSDGSKHRVCSHDNSHVEQGVIPATGHDYGEWIIDIAATCTSDGSKHRVCSHDANHTEQETIPALGHDYGEWIIDTAATCTTAGARHRVCNRDANHTEQETIPATGHTYVNGVCSVCGYKEPVSVWVLTSLADITADDVFVIVGKNSSGSYAMTNNNGTSNPPATYAVTIANNMITNTVASNIQWNLELDSTNYIFHPNGTTSTWLYCTSTNNGVRVGTNSSKTFAISENGYLQHVGTNRYVGIYNSSDWRCYTSEGGNIAGQTFSFYVKTAQSTNPRGTLTITSPSSTDLIVGDSASLTYSWQAHEDAPSATISSASWESSDPTVISISNGTYTALKAGSATITLTATDSTDEEYTITNNITVSNPPFVLPEMPNGDYVKVTSSMEDYTGYYLVVNETDSVCLNGSLSTLDVVHNGYSITIEDDSIYSNSSSKTDTLNAKAVYIYKNGSHYDIAAHIGDAENLVFIGNDTSGDNKIAQGTEQTFMNTISFDTKMVISGSGGKTFGFNSASDQQRFRFMGNSNVVFYKKTVGVDTLRSIEVVNATSTFKDGDTFTFDGSVTATYSMSGTTGHTGITTGLSFSVGGTPYTPGTTTLSRGEYTVVVTYNDGSKSVSTDWPITVGYADATTVTIGGNSSISVHKGYTGTFTATVSPETAQQGVTWSVTDTEGGSTSLGTINSSTGYFQAGNTAGSLFVVATSADGLASSHVTVTITGDPLIELDKNSISAYSIDNAVSLTATPQNFPSGTVTYSWSSNDTNVATVSDVSTATASVSFTGGGETSITVIGYVDGVQKATASCTVTVTKTRSVTEAATLSATYDFTDVSEHGTAITDETIGNINNSTYFTADDLYPLDTPVVSLPDYVASTTNYVYFGNASGGAYENQGGMIKFGKSKKYGSINFTFTHTITRVEVEAQQWTSDGGEGTIYINGTAPESNAGAASYATVVADDLSTTSVTISSSDTSARVFIKSITFYSAQPSAEIGRSSDVLGLESFVENKLKWSSYHNDHVYGDNTGDGSCAGFYDKNGTSGAKYAFNNLNLHQKTIFTTNSAYASEWLRLQEWARANGESLDTSTMTLKNSPRISPLLNVIGQNTNTVAIIVIISMVSVTAIGGYFFLRKRKENI